MNVSITPSEHRGVGGAAEAQQQRRWGLGVRHRVAGAAGKRQPQDTDRVSVEWRRGRRKTTHTHTYADSPPHAQPVLQQPVHSVVPPLPLGPHGSIRLSEDTRGYTHNVATHIHTDAH
eukprot:GHVU01225833.1.p3 GENE.GHVU01225833.1~~GHVU01225833.1.p3  ORF type:complete len:118 (-),score=13.77 GHVU01225833.1:90-443(-)